MCKPFVGKHDLPAHHLDNPFCVVSPCMRISSHMVVPDVSVKMGNYSVLPFPIFLANFDIDLILGMDFLAMKKAYIYYAAKEIKLTHPYEHVTIFTTHDDTIRLFSLNEKGEISTIFSSGCCL